ncbi:MAG TPA: hypothetical protein DC000_02785 [Clostridiales bacterium]|nr:hypothetical protein [Clostridiales bacterium]
MAFMYLGSVKFYKHLIYFTTIVILVLAIIGLIFLISLVIPNSNAEAASIDNMNTTSYNQAAEKDTSIKETFNNQASSEQTNKSADINSEEPMVFEVYPDLYCEKSDIKTNDTKTAYITFDDGPSSTTTKILDILKKRDIKATFFVVTGDYNAPNLDLLKQINDEGHALGIHSHSHIYKEIYDSKESFLKEINDSFNIIYEKTSVKPTVIRFPGGSINKFNSDIYEDITSEVLNRNFRYYDWNVSFEDAKNDATVDEIYQNVLDGIEKNNENDLVILAHDRANNNNMLEALEKVIDVLESYDYSFDKLDNSVEPITFYNK